MLTHETGNATLKKQIENMMNVVSKFSKMYFAKVVIGYSAGILFATIFFSKSITSDGELNFHYGPCWLGILIVFFLIIGSISILKMQTITVNEKGIVLKYIFLNKSKILQYDQIVNIERFKTQGFVKSGPVSDGYHSIALILNKDKYIVISPDEYENYTDIVYAIRSNMKHEA